LKKVNWGILGLGNIGFKFSESFGNLKNAKLKGASSRNKEKLIKFGKQCRIEKEFLFEDYYDLIKCKNIDIIYIALPNSLHYYWIIECIKNNKKILVEKPATMNFVELQDIAENHFNKNVFFTEAFMYRYHPQITKLIELLNSKIIGNPTSMESVFGIDIINKKKFFFFKKKKINKENRLFNKSLGGGVILDLGSYPVSFSTLIASLVSKIDYEKIKLTNKKKEICSTGVEIDASLEINFGDNFKSSIAASFNKNLGKYSKIIGTKGELFLSNTWDPQSCEINITGENQQRITIESLKNVYTHQIEKISKNILENKSHVDYPGLTIFESLENMKIIDNWKN
jgi:predicted dehydrogenase|tara:strand:+ start:731 stop:1753 length:1023 start_codon:yes stop_codon:yes gene_type:complete